MILTERLHILSQLRDYILSGEEGLEQIKLKSFRDNKWFTIEFIDLALHSIANHYLNGESLAAFAKFYQIPESRDPKRVALIPAGNIPLVGFHDMLCVFLSGHHCVIKSSSKDAHLLKHLVETMISFKPETRELFSFVEVLKDFDAVIATGSDNSSRYFEYYFKDYPHIIRKNRNGIAVLSGKETDEEMEALGDDVFQYFGLGCRSVSKIYLPRDYDVKQLFAYWKRYHECINHHKYANNFDYNSANYILGETPFLTNNIFILKEDDALVSRIATIHYAFYDDIDELSVQLRTQRDQIQCISSHLDLGDLPTVLPGMAQKPSLTDFADGVDTLKFLMQI